MKVIMIFKKMIGVGVIKIKLDTGYVSSIRTHNSTREKTIFMNYKQKFRQKYVFFIIFCAEFINEFINELRTTCSLSILLLFCPFQTNTSAPWSRMKTSPLLNEPHRGGTSLIRTLLFPFTCSRRVTTFSPSTLRKPDFVPPGR